MHNEYILYTCAKKYICKELRSKSIVTKCAFSNDSFFPHKTLKIQYLNANRTRTLGCNLALYKFQDETKEDTGLVLLLDEVRTLFKNIKNYNLSEEKLILDIFVRMAKNCKWHPDF